MQGVNICWFVILTLVQTMFDSTYCRCVSTLGRVLLVIHHAINIGFIIGSVLFGNHLLHMIILLGSLFLHITLRGCFLTKINNSLCKTEGTLFTTFGNHIMRTLNLSHLIYPTYYVIAMLVVIYDLYFVLNA